MTTFPAKGLTLLDIFNSVDILAIASRSSTLN